ncbi:MAG TPA: hypothetical protein VG713_01905 [Pirellulales bacterium]|nr:hypothetical protein [Pirellulales bacterium]
MLHGAFVFRFIVFHRSSTGPSAREAIGQNRVMRRCVCSFVICLSSASMLAFCARSRGNELTLVGLDTDPLLDRAIFRRLVSHPDHHVRFADSGAASSNVDAESQTDDAWFIESQRYGADLVEAGRLCRDPQIVELGWKLIEWGFARQGPDGSFPGTGDPFHSTSFFVEAVARALLVTQQTNSADDRARTQRYAPRLSAAAHWMLGPKVLPRGLNNNRPYAHRRWLLAAALGEAARLVPDPALVDLAEDQAREGLALQRPDGVNPEKDGFDVSYQAAGLMFAARYYTVCDDQALRASIQKMLERGLDWELTKIAPGGQIDVEGSTRVTNETGRTGTAKTVDYKAIVFALTYGAKILDRRDYHSAAERVARHLRWIKD